MISFSLCPAVLVSLSCCPCLSVLLSLSLCPAVLVSLSCCPCLSVLLSLSLCPAILVSLSCCPCISVLLSLSLCPAVLVSLSCYPCLSVLLSLYSVLLSFSLCPAVYFSLSCCPCLYVLLSMSFCPAVSVYLSTEPVIHVLVTWHCTVCIWLQSSPSSVVIALRKVQSISADALLKFCFNIITNRIYATSFLLQARYCRYPYVFFPVHRTRWTKIGSTSVLNSHGCMFPAAMIWSHCVPIWRGFLRADISRILVSCFTSSKGRHCFIIQHDNCRINRSRAHCTDF